MDFTTMWNSHTLKLHLKYHIEKTTEVLIDLAYQAGGFDNISLVVIEGDKDES